MKSGVILCSNLYTKNRAMLLATLLIGSSFSCSKMDIVKPATEKTETAAILGAVTSNPNLIYEETFENSPFLPGVGSQFGTTYGLKFGNFNSRNCARFELRDTDPETSSGTRAEIKLYDIDDLSALTKIDQWYAFDTYFPSADWAYDSHAEIITQFHQGMSTSPSISLITRYDKMVVEVRSVVGEKVQYPLGDVVKDKWQSNVMHIIHSHGSDGLIEIWKDGVKIFSHSGPNSYDWNAGADKPKWKLGLYKWDWNGTGTTDTHKRVLFIDNIKLGNEKALLTDLLSGISPTTTTTTTPPTTTTTTPTTTSMAINSFTLINSGTEKDAMTVTEGAIISLAKIGFSKLNIRANPSTTVGSVKFVLSGAQSKTYKDNASPYALMGDDGSGNYYFGTWGPPPVGSYTLTATPYSADDAAGTAGTAKTIHFTITK